MSASVRQDGRETDFCEDRSGGLREVGILVL